MSQTILTIGYIRLCLHDTRGGYQRKGHFKVCISFIHECSACGHQPGILQDQAIG